MSPVKPLRRKTVVDIRSRKGGEPIVCLTAYTALMTELLDPYADLLLVGDSVGTVLHGHDTTIPVTLEEMIFHARSVKRANPFALLVVDLPFGSYEESPQKAYETASRILKETGADAVKLEGGVTMAETIAYLVERGAPVMAHIGLRPQAVRATGGYRVVGKTDEEWTQMREDADAITNAGAFCVVIEGVVEPLAAAITEQIDIPTIGIGASASCDGQIIVSEDMLGLVARTPKFVRQFANLRETIDQAVAEFAQSVRQRSFPAEAETYGGDNAPTTSENLKTKQQ